MMSRLIIPPSLLHRTPAAGGRTTDGAVLEKAQTADVEQSVRGKRPRDGKIDFPWSAQEVQQQKFGLAKFLPSRV